MKEVVVIGGGYGLYEILPLIDAINEKSKDKIKVIGILDDSTFLQKSEIHDLKVLGKISDWMKFDIEVEFIFAIGSFKNHIVRQKIINNNRIPVTRFCTLVHPSSDIMIPKNCIGAGCIIHSGVKIHPLSVVGNFCTISANCIIGVKNTIASFSLFAANVTSATDIQFGSCSFLGTGAIIAPDISIGCGAQIGVGAVVFRNVDTGHKVLGNPAKPYGKQEVAPALLDSNKSELEMLNKKRVEQTR